MKITDLTIKLFKWEGIPPRRQGDASTSQLGLVTISTDEGLQGHAFLGSSMATAEDDGPGLIRYLKPLVMGQNPLDRERLWQELWTRNRQVSFRAIGAIDCALWDLGAKAAGLPLHKLLGSYRTSVPAYASSAPMDKLELFTDEVAHYKERGWTAYKIHPPRIPAYDIEVCAAVREVAGSDFTLMLDSMWSYDYPWALRVGKAIEELDYYWYEDPLPEDDLGGYVKLRKNLDIPLMATEYAPGGGFTAFAPWLQYGATDYLRGDIQVKGGITPLIKAAHMAEAFHLNFEMHHGGNSLNNIAQLHVIMAMKNCEFLEVLLPDVAQKYGISEDIEVDSNGMAHASDKVGIGAEIDFAMIEKMKAAELS